MKVFEKNIYLRTSDYDAYDRLTPAAIFDIFQDIAGLHADELGVGYEDFKKRGLIWVLLRNRYDVIKYPQLFSEVKVKTWPHEPGRADFDRDYLICDLDGNVLIKGSSKWCVCNLLTRKLVFGDAVKYNIEGYSEDKNYPEGLVKIKPFDHEGFREYAGKTAFCDLDHNGHVNNAKYTNYIMNALCLPKEESIKTFEIDYVKELPAECDFKVFHYKENDGYIVKCVTDADNFRAHISIQK